METDHISFYPDLPYDQSQPIDGSLKYSLRLHEEVPEILGEMPHLHRRLGLVLQHLASRGSTGVVKSCQGANRGWLRTPLGGNGGMQYYLWWAPQGNGPVASLDTEGDGIRWVRAVRHHDDHATLDAGDIHDYYELTKHNLTGSDETFNRAPWTESQLRFVNGESPVRVLYGYPGSGKTTSLWRAVETRDNQRVLYLTWSSTLTESTQERFETFAPHDTIVEARDFRTFLGVVSGTDVNRLSVKESYSRFTKVIDYRFRDLMGPWAGREEALYAEMRAFLLGYAIPEVGEAIGCGRLLRLSDLSYRQLRGGDNGVGSSAAESFLNTINAAIDAQPDDVFDSAFPELVAAAEAIRRLHRGELPDGFGEFDRIVIDEVQDLTLIEVSAVLGLCEAIARRLGRWPWLLIAGDSGQTVRPSGFDSGRLNNLLTSRLSQKPDEFPLESNLRSPRRIAGVIERATNLYSALDKGTRPTDQIYQVSDEYTDAQLFHVNVADAENAEMLLTKLVDLENVVVISAEGALPEWVPHRLQNQEMVLTPAEAKGMEYQAVCVLEPGKLLKSLAAEDTASADAPELVEQAHRTAIDRLRVALSRATESLALVDVAPDSEARRLSRELLGDEAAPYDVDDLVEHFTDADALPEDRVMMRVDETRNVIDTLPGRAWQRIRQAQGLLGEADLPNGVSDTAIRKEVQETLFDVAARLLINGPPSGETPESIVESTVAASDDTDRHDMIYELFRELSGWSVNRTECAPFPLLNAALVLNERATWLRNALPPVHQTLQESLDRYASEPGQAGQYSGDVVGWLDLAGYVGDADEKAMALRSTATDTLIQSNDVEAAEKVWRQIKPEVTLLTGRLREAQGRLVEAAEIFEREGARDDAIRNWHNHGSKCEASNRFEDAAAAFERAARSADALRNWRNVGNWERSVELADGPEKVDLQWLIDMDNLLQARPSGHSARLTDSERTRLESVSNTLRKTAAHPNSGTEPRSPNHQ